MVEYHPISGKDQSRLHQFGSKVLPGKISRLCTHCTRVKSGKETPWSQTLKKWRRWTHLNSTRRLNAKEVLTPLRSENFIFLFADGTVQIFGRERRLRTSNLTWERPERGEDQEILQGNSDEWYATSHLQEDLGRDDEEVKNDFWAITGEFIYRHHVVPGVKLYVPKEESFPIPLKFIGDTRTTHTSQDVLLEKHIDDYWNVDGEKELSDAWTSFTRFIL